MKRTSLRTLVHPLTVATTLATLSSFAFTMYLVSVNVSDTQRKLDEQVQDLSRLFASDEFPSNCKSRKLPYFYRVQEKSLNVLDRNADDWRLLRVLALKSNELEFGSGTTLFTLRPCAYLTTPHDANQILALDHNDETHLRSSESILRLRYARDDGANALYVLGQLASKRQVAPPDRFRLRLEYANLTEDLFDIKMHPDGGLTWHRIGFFHDAAKLVAMDEETNRRYEANFLGAWWDTESNGQTQRHIEFRLRWLDILTAFQLSADWRIIGSGGYSRLITRVGTENVVPLYTDIKTYKVERHLPQHVQYDLYLLQEKTPFLLTSSSSTPNNKETNPVEASDEHRTYSFPLVSRFFGMFNQLYYFVANYEPCSILALNETSNLGTCIRREELGPGEYIYYMRKGKLLKPTSHGQTKRIMFLEEKAPILLGNSVLYIGVVFLLGFLSVILVYSHRKRVGTSRELNSAYRKLRRTGEDLEKNHAKLKCTYVELERVRVALREKDEDITKLDMTLKNFGYFFLHEISGRITRLHSQLKTLLGPVTERSGADRQEVDVIISTLPEILEETGQILQLRLTVREAIRLHGHKTFCLQDTIEDIIAYKREEGHDVRRYPPQESGVPLMLPSAFPEDEKESSPDRYVEQALEKVVNNALDYGTQGTVVTISLQLENSDAVVKISNRGPLVPEEKLESVFELGTRFTGADGNANEKAPHREEENNRHLGIGLYICSQIVEGYGGTCRMDNNSDGAGVIVTVRLPCTPAAVPG